MGVLSKMGYEVIIPRDLKCCGRPLLSLGDHRAAAELAEYNREQFAKLEGDAIVTACASCSLTFKQEYPRLLPPGRSRLFSISMSSFHADQQCPNGPFAEDRYLARPCTLAGGRDYRKQRGISFGHSRAHPRGDEEADVAAASAGSCG